MIMICAHYLMSVCIMWQKQLLLKQEEPTLQKEICRVPITWSLSTLRFTLYLGYLRRKKSLYFDAFFLFSLCLAPKFSQPLQMPYKKSKKLKIAYNASSDELKFKIFLVNTLPHLLIWAAFYSCVGLKCWLTTLNVAPTHLKGKGTKWNLCKMD